MLVHKLRAGVLHLSTPDGLRCVALDRSERLLFLWVFRNFKVLPEIVLSDRTVRALNQLLSGDRPLQRCSCVHPEDRYAVIGTIECSAAMKKPPRSATEWAGQQMPQLTAVPAGAAKN